MVSKETLGLIESMKGIGIAIMGFVLIILGYMSGDAGSTTGLTAGGIALISIYYGKHTQSPIVDQLMNVIKETQTVVATPAVTHFVGDVKTGTAPTIDDMIKIFNDPIVQKTLSDAKAVLPEAIKPLQEDLTK